MVPSQDSHHAPTRVHGEGGVVSSTQGVLGAGKIDELNGGGLRASCLVAAHLWRRVMRVHRRRSRVSLDRTRPDPWHAARTCPDPCNAHDASSLLETGALEELLRDVKVERAQHLLWLLAATGADLCKGGARAGLTRGGNATLSAAQVLKHVMSLMCDVGELSAIAARKAPPGRSGTEVQATGGKEVAACLEWRELWAVACVPGDVMGADVMGRSPLHSAALAGNAGALQVLLAAGANVASQDWRGWTALHVAANHGHTACVDVLLSFAGALDDTEHRSKGVDMAVPRHTSEEDHQVVGAPFMQSAQSARNLAQIVDGMGRSPLHVWSYLKHKKSEGGTDGGVSRAFKLLVLASRCTFSHELDGGWTQLHVCGANGSSQDWLYMAQSLAAADVTLPERSSQGRSAVAVAAATGNTAIVETFVRRRMGPLDLTDARARTLLDLVCVHSLPLAADCLELLWHAVSVLGRWPLGVSVPLVNLIHSIGNQSREGKKASSAPALDQVLADESLLSIASASGNVATVKRLLDLRASPDSVSRARQPSEHQGVPAGHVRGESGRDGGLALVSNKEPLVVACRRGHEELVRVLVQRGGARVDMLSTSCGVDAYRQCMEEGSSRRAMWCERMLWTGGRETPVVTCLRHRYFDLALVLLRTQADCDVGWVRDPAAGLNHQDFTTAKMSALMVLMLLAPCRDASSVCLPSVVCRVWEQIADAMVIHGLVTDDAVLQEGLRFVDGAAAGRHLTELGLSVVGKVSSNGRLGSRMPHADPPKRPPSGQVVVDLLSLVCARGYSECAAGLIKGLSESSVASLRAAGRLEQPLRIAMHTGDTLIIRLLVSRVCPVIPARSPHSAGICLIDMAASSSWVRGSVARHAEQVWQHSVLLDALHAGRWEAIVELVEYLAKLLSMSESESGARNLAFGGHEAAGHHASSIHTASSMHHAASPAAALEDGARGVRDVGARGAGDVGLEHRPPQSASAARFTGPRREEMFGLWVKEGLVSPRIMPLGIHTDARKVERACAPIYSLLDGLSPESLDVRSGEVGGGAQEQRGHVVHECMDVLHGWRFDSGSLRRFDADSSFGHRPMYEHGGGLDANSERILNAMQHVVDMRGLENVDTRMETKKPQTSADTDKLQSADANVFASALDSSTDDNEDEQKQQQEEEAKDNQLQQSILGLPAAGARGSRRSRIGEMRKHGVARAKEAQTPLAVKRLEEARHHSLVHHQRQLVRCVAQREGLQVPLGVRILLIRRLAQVRYGLPGPPKTSAPSQPFLKMCSPGCLRVSVLCICVCLCVTA
jgi:ankyrin repeat protein